MTLLEKLTKQLKEAQYKQDELFAEYEALNNDMIDLENELYVSTDDDEREAFEENLHYVENDMDTIACEMSDTVVLAKRLEKHINLLKLNKPVYVRLTKPIEEFNLPQGSIGLLTDVFKKEAELEMNDPYIGGVEFLQEGNIAVELDEIEVVKQ